MSELFSIRQDLYISINYVKNNPISLEDSYLDIKTIIDINKLILVCLKHASCIA